MSTTLAGDVTTSTVDSTILECAPNMEAPEPAVTGGEELKAFASKHSYFIAWVALICVFSILTIFILWTMGYVSFGKSTVSTYSSSFVNPPSSTFTSRFGNNPNWRMTSGDAGYGSSIDIPGSERSLGFNIDSECPVHKNGYSAKPKAGVNNFVDHATIAPRPGIGQHIDHATINRQNNAEHLNQRYKSNLDNPDEARKQAEMARLEREVRQKQYEEQQMTSCGQNWDPLATEEARVLSSVGSYRQASAGMGTFNKVINENCNATLSDAQLEAIMQGGEPFTVDRFDQLPTQNRPSVTQKPLKIYQ